MNPEELAKEAEEEQKICQEMVAALNQATQKAIKQGKTLVLVEGNNLVRINFTTGKKEFLRKLPPRKRTTPGI